MRTKNIESLKAKYITRQLNRFYELGISDCSYTELTDIITLLDNYKESIINKQNEMKEARIAELRAELENLEASK